MTTSYTLSIKTLPCPLAPDDVFTRNMVNKNNKGQEFRKTLDRQLERQKENKQRTTAAQVSVSKQKSDKHTRLVMVGKTGVGKSATCNRILGGGNIFEEKASQSSVTKACMSCTQTLADGRRVTIVDTPGLFDSKMTQEETTEEVMACIEFCFPGPHAFILVLSCTSRFTDEEHDTLMEFKEIFGEDIFDYTIVLFTNSSAISGTIENYIAEFPEELNEIIQECGDRKIFVDNGDDENNETYTRELFNMIDKLVKKNGDKYYANEKFEKEQIEEEVKMRKEKEIKAREGYKREIEELGEEIMIERSRRYSDIKKINELERRKRVLSKKIKKAVPCLIL